MKRPPVGHWGLTPTALFISLPGPLPAPCAPLPLTFCSRLDLILAKRWLVATNESSVSWLCRDQHKRQLLQRTGRRAVQLCTGWWASRPPCHMLQLLLNCCLLSATHLSLVVGPHHRRQLLLRVLRLPPKLGGAELAQQLDVGAAKGEPARVQGKGWAGR